MSGNKWTPPELFKFGPYTVGVDTAREGGTDSSVATWAMNDHRSGVTLTTYAVLHGYDRDAFLAIMRAVNSHAALVEACETAADELTALSVKLSQPKTDATDVARSLDNLADALRAARALARKED